MYLSDVLRAVWDRWLTVLLVVSLAVAAAAGVVLLTAPTYESTATMGLVPGGADASGSMLGQIAVAAPLFTETAKSAGLRAAARKQLPPGANLGELTVNTFQDTPLVFKLVVTSDSARGAHASATAYGRALVQVSQAGEILPGNLAAVRLIGAPVRPDAPVSPRPRETLLVAGFVGLLLGVVAAVVREGASGRLRDAGARAQGPRPRRRGGL